MNVILEILKIILPSLVVFFTAYFLIKFFLENEQKKRLLELRYHSKETMIPLRLQAYERMALFLERIDPNQLILRMNSPQLTAFQFQILLVSAIRSEYEHNLSQQIYISENSWNHIKMAKEETIKTINLCAGKLTPASTSTELATYIFERVAQKSTTEDAMKTLKKEIEELF